MSKINQNKVEDFLQRIVNAKLYNASFTDNIGLLNGKMESFLCIRIDLLLVCGVYSSIRSVRKVPFDDEQEKYDKLK